MKVFTRVVIDMASGRCVEEDSFQYSGCVAECKGSDGDTPTIPETAEEIEASKIAKEQWNDYQKYSVPVENQFIHSVHLDQGDRDQVAGQVSSGSAKNTSELQKATSREAQARGAAPGAGRSVMATGGALINAAGGAGKAQISAGESVTDQDIAGRQAVVAMGRGQATSAQIGLGGIAADAVRKAMGDAAYNQEERYARRAEVGSGIGMAGAVGYKALKSPAAENDPVKVGRSNALDDDWGDVNRFDPVSSNYGGRP